MKCKEFHEYIEEYVDRTLDRDSARRAELHLSVCSECAGLVKELECASAMVRALDREGAPVGFEQRLKERLASQRAAVSPAGLGARLRSIFSIPAYRSAAKPALAGLACAAVIGSILLFGQNHWSEESQTDWAYIEVVRQQHASFAAANPLADDSAVILRERAQELGNGL